jgi:hypothetical protein
VFTTKRNAFQELIAALVENDEKAAEDEATRIVRERIRKTKPRVKK